MIFFEIFDLKENPCFDFQLIDTKIYKYTWHSEKRIFYFMLKILENEIFDEIRDPLFDPNGTSKPYL